MAMAMLGSGRICVLVVTTAPSDEEWQSWVELLRERNTRDIRALIESYDAGPNAKQRKALGDAMQGLDVRAAVLTDSAFVRALITAFAWLGISQRAFPLNGHIDAANYLGLVEFELDEIMRELPRLRHEAAVGLTRRVAPS